MQAATFGDRVRLDIVGRLDDGSVITKSSKQEPIEVSIGQQQLLPALEQALIGMNIGEKKSTRIETDQAFGPHREQLVVDVDRDKLSGTDQPTVGQSLQVKTTDGQSVKACITDVSADTVTLDANHPLAGKDLHFDVELLDIVG